MTNLNVKKRFGTVTTATTPVRAQNLGIGRVKIGESWSFTVATVKGKNAYAIFFITTAPVKIAQTALTTVFVLNMLNQWKNSWNL